MKQAKCDMCATVADIEKSNHMLVGPFGSSPKGWAAVSIVRAIDSQPTSPVSSAMSVDASDMGILGEQVGVVDIITEMGEVPIYQIPVNSMLDLCGKCFESLVNKANLADRIAQDEVSAQHPMPYPGMGPMPNMRVRAQKRP